MDAITLLYAENVRFYGQRLGRKDVIARKRQALEKTPTFVQTVTGEPRIEPSGGEIRVVFKKRSGPRGKEQDALATLILSAGRPLEIVEETDAATKKRRGEDDQRAAAPTNCEDAVGTLVASTLEWKRLGDDIDKNLKGVPASANLNPGGMGPFMPSETGDGTYEMSIGVHHPDRFEAYGWFTVSATGKVTVNSFALELSDAPATPTKEALADFTRLCGH
jgi:hypothetical protein